MITVAMVMVLAALGIQRVRHYIAYGYSAEARQTVGAIARSAVRAADRLRDFDDVAVGDPEVTEYGLCGDSVAVPASITMVTNKKYQPSSAAGSDYQSGDRSNGWLCLEFEMSTLQAYQYRYQRGAPPAPAAFPGNVPPHSFSVSARGDRDGNGIRSYFAIVGTSNNGEIRLTNAIHEHAPAE